MKKSRFTEAQIMGVLRQVGPVAVWFRPECSDMGVLAPGAGAAERG
jgi:hypothetical protein